MYENKNIDKKSIRFLQGRNIDWTELAKDCVSFANAQGGFILIGIEDREKLPPENQKITDTNLPDENQVTFRFGHESIFDDHLKISKVLCDSYRTEKHYRNCKSLKSNYFLCDGYVILNQKIPKG